MAVAGAIGIVVLVIQAGAQGGAVIQVDIQRAIHHTLFLLVPIHEGLLFLVRRDKTPAHITGFGQRARHVDFGAIAIPGACFSRNVRLEVFGRALAHQVDGGRRRACTAHQAGGAAHDLDAVVDDHVGERADVLLGLVGDLGRNAVVLEVLDLETAGVKGVALAVTVVAADAGCEAQHFAEGGQVLIVHQLAGDHTDRLRGFAQGQRQFRRRAGRPRGVGAAVFGGQTQPFGIDAGGVKAYGASAGLGGQAVATVVIGGQRQVVARQQSGKTLFDAVSTLQTGTLLACGQARIEGQHHAGITGKSAQYRTQWARRNRESLLLAGRHGVGTCRKQRGQ